jgi:hypothetical protein
MPVSLEEQRPCPEHLSMSLHTTHLDEFEASNTVSATVIGIVWSYPASEWKPILLFLHFFDV